MNLSQVSFDALIKSISVKSLVSGDKEGEIRLRFLPTDELLDGLNRLHRADAEVSVGIVAMIDNENKHAVPKRKPGLKGQG